MDHEAQPRQYEKQDWQNLTAPDLLAKVHAAGIIGVGGAGFPTHVKLKPPPDSPVDTLLLNAVGCEPCRTGEERRMGGSPEHNVEGAKIILKILGIKDCYIGIENNKPDAIREIRITSYNVCYTKLLRRAGSHW